VRLLEAEALKPLNNQGWSFEAGQPGNNYWKADQPGSVIEFEVAGQAILFMGWHVRGPMGQANVRVNDRPAVLREAWFDQIWGGYRQTTLLARDLGPGKHRVRIELQPETRRDLHTRGAGRIQRLHRWALSTLSRSFSQPARFRNGRRLELRSSGA
jgi:hypothetical protein